MATKMKMLPLLSGVVVLFATGAASATTTYISGSECYAQGFAISPTGTVNNDNFNRSAVCPIPSWSYSSIPGNDNPQAQGPVLFSRANDGVVLNYDVENSSEPFNCVVTVDNWDGHVTKTNPLYSCNIDGGCTGNAKDGKRGGGQLRFTKGFPNSLGPLADVNNGLWYPTEMAIVCTVPGYGSIIKGYNITTKVP